MFQFLPLLLAIATPVAAATPAEQTASGTFDVAIEPDAAVTGTVGVLALTKTYQGDLTGSSTGQMLGAGDPASGTASYVVIEQVEGTLSGRKGGFRLQHSGWMHAKQQEMRVILSPGSGTGALAGMAGSLNIAIAGGVHRYTLRYTLP